MVEGEGGREGASYRGRKGGGGREGAREREEGWRGKGRS